MTGFILDDVKKVLGVEATDDVFDIDIIMHINTAFFTLTQLGVGPAEGFMIENNTSSWTDFLDNEKTFNAVKSYVYIRVRLLFDPPTTSFAITSLQEQAKELEWRLNVYAESLPQTVSIPE